MLANHRIVFLAGFALLLSPQWGMADDSSTLPGERETNRLSETIFQTGIAFPDELFPVQKPSLTAAMTEQEKLDVLTKLAGNHGWAKFSRDHVRAPVSIRMELLKSEDGKRLGYSVKSRYIVYATLEELRDHDLMQSTFGGGKDDTRSVTEPLKDEELEQLEIASEDEAHVFARILLPLLNQVELKGVVELEKVDSPDAILLCWQLHPKFSAATNDAPATFRNEWASLRPNSRGDLVRGDPQPYQGLGGMISITKTDQAENQLLFESQLLIHEPEGWFPGKPNYLRTKIPTSMGESAKKFRNQIRNSKR